jgi:hypothetical protein
MGAHINHAGAGVINKGENKVCDQFKGKKSFLGFDKNIYYLMKVVNKGKKINRLIRSSFI